MVVTIDHVDAIPVGEGRAFAVGERRIAVFRNRKGELFATQASCPHRQGPLFDGLVGGSTVICPLHGLRFDLATGCSSDSELSLETYPVHIDEQGRVLVELDS
ncbi:MAG TPA: Rieske 2Fe-2S domain-containing protein [Polyangiaceae bacterium]